MKDNEDHKKEADANNDEIKIEIRDKKSKSAEEISSDNQLLNAETSEIDTEEIEVEPDELGELKNKLKEQEDKYLRLAAEFDNVKKRIARQFDNMTISSAERIIAPLLEVVDNFGRGLEAAENSTGYESLKKGMELTYQQLTELLKKEGLEAIESLGKQFDPNLHEAMMQLESEEEEGIIVQELVKGYKLKGRVIRHARVAVSRGDSTEADDAEATENDVE